MRDTESDQAPREEVIMPRVSAVPYSAMDPELKAIVHASDEALNGSEWVQYFCHPKDLYKSFVKFYYDHVATEEYGISWKLSEMMRHMVAVHNTCSLRRSVTYPSAREQGLSDEMVAAIPNFRESAFLLLLRKRRFGLQTRWRAITSKHPMMRFSPNCASTTARNR
jgi:hypothetical protein